MIRSDGKKIRVLDGSFKAELSNVSKDFFNVERPNWTFDSVIHDPEKVIMVHKRFLDAGVTDITTNTYHASLFSLEEQGLNGFELIKNAVGLLNYSVSTHYSGSGLRIWGSIGSYAICFRGQAAEYSGSFVDILPPVDIMKTMVIYHQNQIEAMTAAGIRDLLFETISSVKEAMAICEALKSYDDIKVVISFTCRQNSNLLRHGETLESAVRNVMKSPKVIGFGINCTHPGTITTLLESVQHVIDKKEVFVYPNNGKFEFYESEEEPLQTVMNSIKRWVDLGVTVIGGCCGFGAEDINEIRKKIETIHQ